MNRNYDVEDLEITDYEIEIVEEKLDNIEAQNGQQYDVMQAVVAMQKIRSSRFTVNMIADKFDLRRDSVDDALVVCEQIGNVQKVGEAHTGGRKASVYSYVRDTGCDSFRRGDWR